MEKITAEIVLSGGETFSIENALQHLKESFAKNQQADNLVVKTPRITLAIEKSKKEKNKPQQWLLRQDGKIILKGKKVDIMNEVAFRAVTAKVAE